MTQRERVQLYVYDLSQGLAKAFSPMLLGKQIDGVWHTSVVVGGTEYFYGHGINAAAPGTTPCGTPLEILDLGHTELDSETREGLLADLSLKYTPQAYSLFSNNCNNFSDEFANILVGRGIPAHITGLPAEVLRTPFGKMLQPALAGLEQQLGAMGTATAVPSSAGREAAQVLGNHVAEALGRAGAPAEGSEPISPRSLERSVGSAIAHTMAADRSAHAGVSEATPADAAKDCAEAQVLEEAQQLEHDPNMHMSADEAATVALRHEADRLGCGGAEKRPHDP